MDILFLMIEILTNVWIGFGHKLKEKWFGIQITFMENQHKDLMLSIFEVFWDIYVMLLVLISSIPVSKNICNKVMITILFTTHKRLRDGFKPNLSVDVFRPKLKAGFVCLLHKCFS